MNFGFNNNEKQNSLNPLLDGQTVFLFSFFFTLPYDFFGYNGSYVLIKIFHRVVLKCITSAHMCPLPLSAQSHTLQYDFFVCILIYVFALKSFS